jgi:hypothetical protein
MILHISDYANELPSTGGLSYLPDYITNACELSPIDEFGKSLSSIIKFGDVLLLESNDFLGRLLVAGLVSAFENYARSITSGVINICPIAQTSASEKAVNFGSMIWHGESRFVRSAFENHSFADSKGLKTLFKDYAGLPLPDNEFSNLLSEFERVCQLRHGIVHADGFLPGKNALKLEIPRQELAARIVIRHRHLHEIANILDSLSKLLNRHVFYNLCQRWAVDWRKRSDWNPQKENNLFAQIWRLCRCEPSSNLPVGSPRPTKAKCMKEVKAKFGVFDTNNSSN